MGMTPTHYVLSFIVVCISLGLIKPVVNNINTVFVQRSLAKLVYVTAAFLIAFILLALFLSGFFFLKWYMPFVASFFGALFVALLERFNPLVTIFGDSGEVVYALCSIALFIATFAFCSYAILASKN